MGLFGRLFERNRCVLYIRTSRPRGGWSVYVWLSDGTQGGVLKLMLGEFVPILMEWLQSNCLELCVLSAKLVDRKFAWKESECAVGVLSQVVSSPLF